jgi:phage terminase large subunit
VAKYTPPAERPKVPLPQKVAVRAPGTRAPDENPWLKFVRRYSKDPVLFVREVFGVDPYQDQIDLLEAYRRGDRRISKRSGHGVGKTTGLAWIIVHHALFRFPQKTVCTAPTSKQLFDALYAETVTWFRKLPVYALELFDIKSESIELKSAPTESFISFRTSSADKPEALAGVHSEYVLLVIDEASGVPEAIFETSIGSMSGHNAVTILCGNPVRLSGLFYDTHNKPEVMLKWTRFHTSCEGHPNISLDFIEDVKARYGELSNAYRVRVLGEFPMVDDDTVIPWYLIEAALNREDIMAKRIRSIWGVDVARKGRDACALAKRRGNVLEEPVRHWRNPDLMASVGKVKAEWDKTPLSLRPEFIFVDAIGLGAGVADRLREMGLPAVAINVAEAAALGEKYVNLRTELWFKGREWLERKDCMLNGAGWRLEGKDTWVEAADADWKDEELAKELSWPTFDYRSNGKMIVEGKKEMMKRLDKPSPNRADAFLLTLVQEAATAMGLTSEISGSYKPWNQSLEVDLGMLV